MKQDLILLPLFAMFLLTFAIGIWMIKLRFKAVKDSGISPGYFLLNRGAKLPDNLAKVTNHYANLFELPVLFYVVCLAIYIGNRVDITYNILAWSFIVLRIVHAGVHTTYNNLRHRRLAFLSGAFILAILWLRLFIQIINT